MASSLFRPRRFALLRAAGFFYFIASSLRGSSLAMNSPVWQLDQQTARLQLGRMLASLNLGRPDRGLSEVRVEAQEICQAELLGLHLPSAGQAEPVGVMECYQRGQDLVAAYSESALWPVRVDVAWRAVDPSEAPSALAAVDAIVSVRTDLLDSWPELFVRSRLATCEVQRLVDPETGRFESLVGRLTQQVSPAPGSGSCCLVFRLADLPFTYAEMIRPGDFQGTTMTIPSSDSPSVVEVRHRLFAERLEKGVILRARVRGVIFGRAGDLTAICACYGALSTADPPLGA